MDCKWELENLFVSLMHRFMVLQKYYYYYCISINFVSVITFLRNCDPHFPYVQFVRCDLKVSRQSHVANCSRKNIRLYTNFYIPNSFRRNLNKRFAGTPRCSLLSLPADFQSVNTDQWFYKTDTFKHEIHEWKIRESVFALLTQQTEQG